MKYSRKYNLIILSALVLNSKDSTEWPCGVEQRKCNKRWKRTVSKIFHTVFYSFNLRMCLYRLDNVAIYSNCKYNRVFVYECFCLSSANIVPLVWRANSTFDLCVVYFIRQKTHRLIKNCIKLSGIIAAIVQYR